MNFDEWWDTLVSPALPVKYDDGPEKNVARMAWDAALALRAEVGTPKLKEWLESREMDIAHDIEDFGELREAFKAIVGREPHKGIGPL